MQPSAAPSGRAPLGRRVRRPDLRRLLRGAGGRARAARQRRARVLVLDRYEIGERQTSACAAPTAWLDNLGPRGLDPADLRLAARPHAPRATARWPLPWTFSTFDYRTLCALLWEQSGRRRVRDREGDGRTGNVVHTDRGDVSRAADRRRARAGAACSARARTCSRRTRALSRGLEVHPAGRGADLELWLDRALHPRRLRLVVPGARRAARSASARSTRALHVKDPTAARWPPTSRRDAVRFQGNWIPHRLRPAVEDGVFFVGDSAGHCLPLTAEGIRTALYFGVACGRELRAVLDGRQDVAAALRALRRVLGVATGCRSSACTARSSRCARLHGRPMNALVRAVRAPPRVALGVPALPRHRAAVVRRCRRRRPPPSPSAPPPDRVSDPPSFNWAPFGPSAPATPAARAAASVPACRRLAPPLSRIPARRVAVVTCMDPRIDPLALLGLRLGRRARDPQRRRGGQRRRDPVAARSRAGGRRASEAVW